MTIKGFLKTMRETANEQGINTAAKFAVKELRLQAQKDTEYRMEYEHQQSVLDTALAGEAQTWIIWMDGGRFDYFKELYPEYFEGELQPVYNGGIGYSGDWADRFLRRSDLDDLGLFSVAPVRSLSGTDFDGREYFAVAPDIDESVPVAEQLAALGYRERKDGGNIVNISPGKCNGSVRTHMADIEGGIIRYLKPHPPFDGVEDLTSGSQKTRKTWHSLWTDETTLNELEAAYVRTYHHAFEAAVDIIPELDGDVYITADHGECLGDCDQLYHGRNHAKHEHLCVVPWFKVDAVK